jgi:hypothetical protein
VFITNNIIRRYTPPTCILEIQGKSSPLSRFKGNNLVRNLWFQLSFGDSKLPEKARIKICGDRSQLEALCETVSEYVQNFLSQTPWEAKPVKIDSLPENPTKPYLQQKGLLDHELYFSSIAHKKEPKIVKLTSTQLFDLANALDDFAKDITLLPIEKNVPVPAISESKVESLEKRVDRPKSPRKLPNWTPTAASFLLATGTTIAGMHFYYQSQSTTNTSVAVNPSLTPTPTTDQNRNNSSNNNVPPPPTTKTIPIPSVSLSPSISNKNTPPPPPVTGETPKTNQQSGQNPNPVNKKGDLLSKYPTPPSTNPETTNKNSQTDRNINSRNRSSDNSGNTNNNDVATIIVGDLRETKPIETPTNNLPETTTTNTTENQETFSGYTPNSPTPENPPTSVTVPNNPITRRTVPNVPPEIDVAVTEPINLPSTVNTVAQVEQVQQYFQGKWQPPTELKEALQYDLSISNSGSLQNITPVGKTAATYLDRTNMPLLNESFVSPCNTTGAIRVRLVLNPDGTVQTFTE